MAVILCPNKEKLKVVQSVVENFIIVNDIESSRVLFSQHIPTTSIPHYGRHEYLKKTLQSSPFEPTTFWRQFKGAKAGVKV